MTDLIPRAKAVAQILTDNGHQVDSPDSHTLDDVEWARWNVCLQIVQTLDDMPPQITEIERLRETLMAGRNALRIMLNLSAPYDKPNTRIATVMDQQTDAEGRTMRVRLEALWEALREIPYV